MAGSRGPAPWFGLSPRTPSSLVMTRRRSIAQQVVSTLYLRFVSAQ